MIRLLPFLLELIADWKFIARFNPYALMVFRCVGFVVLVAGYFVLKNYGL